MSRNNGNGTVKVLLIILILLMIAVTGVLLFLSINLTRQDGPPSQTPGSAVSLPRETRPETQPPETSIPGPRVVSTATVGTMGDMLMHIQLMTTSKTDEGYDFSPIFRYMTPYIQQLDYAAANLETTFGGDGFRYQGNPLFNCRDDFADDLKDMGFDMMLTANNHCGDTLAEGVIRTVEQLEQRGLDYLGTRKDAEGPKYLVKEVNGIKLGMVCYTYATAVTDDGRPALNLNAPLTQAGLVNFFRENNLNKFYQEIQAILDSMKADGAEATIVYLHWGKEYELEENDTQKAMAQKLCDMGVDAIVGGHPHVIQPMDLLTSTQDPEHKTVCIYSMGNVVSNQRRSKMRLKTGHTEDGALFTLTFEKYDDGSVSLASADVLPFWVHLIGTADDPKAYTVIPLDDDRRDSWPELYGLEGSDLAELSNSYNRTMDIIRPGLQKCNDYLAQAKQARENPGAPAAS